MKIRPAGRADLPALQAALSCALDWRGEGGWDEPGALIEQTGHAYLLAGWGRAGDTAFVAEADGRAIGAAWYRSWTDAEHSYGYVDAATPEIGLGVDPAHRGQGIGSALMGRLLAQAERQGVGALALSVERENRSVALYRRLGFERHTDVENSWTMVKRLRAEGDAQVP